MLGVAGVEAGGKKTKSRDRPSISRARQVPGEQQHSYTAEQPNRQPVRNVTLLRTDRKETGSQENR